MKKKAIIILSLISFLIIPIFQGLKWSIDISNCYIDNNLRIANPEEFNLTRAIPNAPNRLDPLDCWEVGGSEVIIQVAETLWFYNWSDPALPRVNMLAESETWKNSTALEITLRQGVLFHDGTPFNASAVKWNIDRMMYLFNHTDALPSGEHVGDTHPLFETPDGSPLLSNFEVTGTYTGIIHLTQPFTSLMDLFCTIASSMISPTAHASDAQSYIDLFTGDLIGTGPYMYDYYVPNIKVQFSRWDNYWREPVLFKNMLFEIITDSITRNYLMLSGDIDYLSGINPDFINAFIADPNITYDESDIPGLTVNYLAFNNKEINITWRKAMSYAFNYNYMISQYYQNIVFRSYGPVSSGFGEWYNSDVETIAPYFNITLARMILAGLDPTPNPVPGIPEAVGRDPLDDGDWGLGDNQLISFNYSYPIMIPTNYREDIFGFLENWFADISIEVLNGGTSSDYFYNRAIGSIPGGYDDLGMFIMGWAPDFLDPINMIQPLFSNVSNANAAQVNDAKLEAMFLQYLEEIDHALKVEIIYNISKYIVSELYSYIYNFHSMTQTCHSVELFDVPYDLNRYIFYAYPIKPAAPFYPQIISSGDIICLEGDINNEINWVLNATELHNPKYYIYRDGIHLFNDTWSFDESININLNGLPVGQYIYKIVVNNGPYSLESYVNVEVGAKLEISQPLDITYIVGSTGNTIIWTIIKGYEQDAIYYIYNDTNGLVQTDSWEIGVPIIFDVDGLSVGNYSYRIQVYNSLEFIEDTVQVSVLASQEKEQLIIGFPVTIIMGLALISVIYIGIKSKYKLN